MGQSSSPSERLILRACCRACAKPNECTLSTRVQNPCDLEFGTQDCTTMLLSGQCRAEHCSRFERPVAVHPDQMEMFGDG